MISHIDYPVILGILFSDCHLFLNLHHYCLSCAHCYSISHTPNHWIALKWSFSRMPLYMHAMLLSSVLNPLPSISLKFHKWPHRVLWCWGLCKVIKRNKDRHNLVTAQKMVWIFLISSQWVKYVMTFVLPHESSLTLSL